MRTPGSLSVPFSSGRWVKLVLTGVQPFGRFLPFSPLFVGSMGETDALVPRGVQLVLPFSPLFVGSMGETKSGIPAPVCAPRFQSPFRRVDG